MALPSRGASAVGGFFSMPRGQQARGVQGIPRARSAWLEDVSLGQGIPLNDIVGLLLTVGHFGLLTRAAGLNILVQTPRVASSNMLTTLGVIP